MAGDTLTVDEDGKDTTVLFKTIMCPLGDTCSKVKKARWPNSSIKSVTNFGALCPYAHHLMELEFPETLQTKINASKHTKDKLIQTVAQSKPLAPFKPSCLNYKSDLSFKKEKSDMDKQELKIKKAKLHKILKDNEDPNLTEYFKEMKQI